MIDNKQIRRELVVDVFDQLDKSGIGHVVLRNHEEIAIGTEKDIDVLAAAGNFKYIRQAIHRAANEHSAAILIERVTLSGLFFTLAFPNDLGTRPVRFHFNTYVPVHTTAAQARVRGLSTRIRYRQISRERVNTGGLSLWAPSPDWAILFLSARLLRKHTEKYLLQVDQLSAVSQRISPTTVSMVHEAASYNDPLKLANALRRALKELSPKKHRLHAIAEWQALIIQSIRSCFVRHGLIVIFSGPDGAGKSTTTGVCANYLKDDVGADVHFVKGLAPINNIFSKQLMWTHNRIRRVPKNISSSSVDLHHRDRAPKSGMTAWKMRRLFGILFYIIQYWPAYLLARIRNHFGQCVIVDTSVHDRFVKAHRPRFPLLEKMAIPLLPLGDLLIQLRAPAEAINARKPELTVAEIIDYYEAMDTILPDSPVVSRVFTDSGVDSTTEKLKKIIIFSIKKQTA